MMDDDDDDDVDIGLMSGSKERFCCAHPSPGMTRETLLSYNPNFSLCRGKH